MKIKISPSAKLLLGSIATVGIAACQNPAHSSSLSAGTQEQVSFSFGDCSGHGGEVKITFGKNTINWERTSFYGRTKENITFSEWNADVSRVKDVTSNPAAEKNSYSYDSKDYKAAFVNLQQMMKSIVKGYACNQPQPAAEKYSEILPFFPTPSKSPGDEANFRFNEGCNKASPQYEITVTDSTINWSVTKSNSNPYRMGYSLDRKSKQIKYVLIDRDQLSLSVAKTLTSASSNYKEAVQGVAQTLRKVVNGLACNAPTPEAQKYADELEAISGS